MQDDAYTMEVRLCDDQGLVTDTPVPSGAPGTLFDPNLTYLKLHNNLRAHNHSVDTRKPTETSGWQCTGHGHYGHHHVRCTNPIHTRSEAPPTRLEGVWPPGPCVGAWPFVVGGTAPSTLNELARQAYATASSKGFWELPDDEDLAKALPIMEAVSDLADDVEALRKGEMPAGVELDPAKRDPYRLLHSLKLLLIVTEVAEVFRALWEGEELQEPEELADILIRVFDYAHAKGYNLDSAVANKMAVNAVRPHKHGRRF